MSISATNGVGKSRTLTHSKVTGTVHRRSRWCPPRERERPRDGKTDQLGARRCGLIHADRLHSPKAHRCRICPARSRHGADVMERPRGVEVLMFFLCFFLFPRKLNLTKFHSTICPRFGCSGSSTAERSGAKTMAVLRVAWRLLLAAVSCETYAGWCVRLLRVYGGWGPAGDA